MWIREKFTNSRGDQCIRMVWHDQPAVASDPIPEIAIVKDAKKGKNK